VSIRETSPGSGETNVFYRSELEVSFSTPHPGDAAVTIPGVSGTSTLNEARTQLVFEHEGLEPETAYTATIQYCRGQTHLDFTTSSYGRPLTTSLVGRVYQGNMAYGRVVEPEGVGAALAEYLKAAWLIEVLAVQGDVIRALVAAAEEGNPTSQEMCASTEELPVGDFSASPYLEAGPAGSATVRYAGEDVTGFDLATSGAFASDGSAFGGGTAQALIDEETDASWRMTPTQAQRSRSSRRSGRSRVGAKRKTSSH
jgi:hypothetical protein